MDCSTDKSWLGDYLLGQCYWAPVFPAPVVPHYLADVENEFINQFFGPTTSYFESDDPPHVGANGYGDVSIRKGFQGFQYGFNDDNLLATSHDLPLRADDEIQLKLGLCVIDDPERMAFYSPDNAKDIITHDAKIMVYPNPFTNETTVLIKSSEFENTNSLTIFDLTGRDATGFFTVKKSEKSNGFIIYNKQAASGYYVIQLKNQSGQTINTKLSIVN